MLWQPMNPDPRLGGAAASFGARDWRGARDKLEAMVAAGQSDAESYAMLAVARHRLGDGVAAHEAADRALALDPRNLRATLAKADLLSEQGAHREANFYHGVLLQLASGAKGLAPELVDGVKRAQAARAKIQSNMLDLVRDRLRGAGYVEGRSSSRFTLALDILTGRRQPYFQQPTAFYYPELPNLQFYDRAQFPWLDAVEAAADAMTGELAEVLKDDAAFSPYQQTAPYMANSDHPLIDSMDWSTCFLWKNGEETANAPRCPQTMAALADAPLCRIQARSPEIMFSQLRPGAHIPPHTGVLNTRLVCHVPLIVPPNCRFRVGNDVRVWEKGKAWVFDDSIDHEAINGSDRTRVVLIFDIWRPELTEEERVLISTLLTAMDAYAPAGA